MPGQGLQDPPARADVALAYHSELFGKAETIVGFHQLAGTVLASCGAGFPEAATERWSRVQSICPCSPWLPWVTRPDLLQGPGCDGDMVPGVDLHTGLPAPFVVWSQHWAAVGRALRLGVLSRVAVVLDPLPAGCCSLTLLFYL